MIRERSPPAAELQHPRQHADIHVDRAIGYAGVVTGTLKVGDCRRGDRGERHVAEVLLDDAEPLLLEFDRASGAPDPFRSQVCIDGFGETLRPLLVNGQSAVSSLLDQLALAASCNAQVRRAEALAITTAVDREVRPGTADRVSRGSYVQLPELRVFIRRGIRPRVNCARADELVHVRGQVPHRASKPQEPRTLAAMSPGAKRCDRESELLRDLRAPSAPPAAAWNPCRQEKWVRRS